MGLNVSLVLPAGKHQCRCSECGDIHTSYEEREVFGANVTHNLNKMAEAAGIYKHLWRPEELDIYVAAQLIEPLSVAVVHMRNNPAQYEALNPSNNWGSYNDFVPWIQKYLNACKEHPSARIEVCR